MIDVFLLLGSNLGNREAYLHEAAARIQLLATLIKQSSVYETQSWGHTNQPDYLNQVLMIGTALAPLTLLNKLLVIESEMGRIRNEKWGSRVIDIDILFYDDQIINEPRLIVPHPSLHMRKFTLAPLVEIAPGLQHPVFKQTVSDLKNNLHDDLIVKKL